MEIKCYNLLDTIIPSTKPFIRSLPLVLRGDSVVFSLLSSSIL
ncbi:hypothetical protein HMPREF9148_01897 [Prevotella sp. F0091]|nr:hypothetical protein HMPREF9148_01897 [Prevotella sp. F0091]